MSIIILAIVILATFGILNLAALYCGESGKRFILSTTVFRGAYLSGVKSAAHLHAEKGYTASHYFWYAHPSLYKNAAIRNAVLKAHQS